MPPAGEFHSQGISTRRMSTGCANGPSSHSVVRETPFVSRDRPAVRILTRYVSRFTAPENAAEARFRILHPLVVFGIHNMQPGGPASSQELLIRADDRQPERFQLQRQRQMQQLR